MGAVILASASADLIRRVRVAADGEVLVLTPEQLPPFPRDVLSLASASDPVQAVIIDPPRGKMDDALRLAGLFDQQFPAVSVLLITNDETNLAVAAMRVGVRDLLQADAGVGDIRWALERSTEATGLGLGVLTTQPRTTGRVFSVTSPKGGVGKTTVAVNLALGLTNTAPHGTVLLDTDLQFGDVGAALGLHPESTMMDVARADDDELTKSFHSFLTRHSSGLKVLCGAETPAEGDAVPAETVGHALETLKSDYQYLVVDTAPGMTAPTLAALRHTTDLVLVTSLDVPSVRGLRKQLKVLDTLDLPHAARHLVINLPARSAGLSVADVEETVGLSAEMVLPRAAKAARAGVAGVPVIGPNDRDKMAKAVMSLVSRLTTTT